MSVKKKIMTILPCRYGERIVHSYLKNTHNVNEEFFSGCIFFCNKGERTEVYCINRKGERLIRWLLNKGASPYSGGLYLGRIVDRMFEPSLQLGKELVLKYKGKESLLINTIRLGEGEALRFTYGKPVELSAVERSNLDPAGYILVINHLSEFIGWGRVKGIKLYPVMDIGWYLRKGG